MTIFSGSPVVASPARPITDYETSFGAQQGAIAAESWSDSPVSQILGSIELNAAAGGARAMPQVDILGNFLGAPQEPEEGASVPTLPRADALERLKQAGVDKRVTLPAQDTIATPVLDIMIQRAQERAEREATIARGPQGFFVGAAGFGTSFLVGAVDPINLASAFIPVMGELRYGKLLASAGESALARASVRAGVGAAQGVVGQAALEPLDWYAHTQEGRDFGMSDVLRNLAFGAALGAGFQSGGGAIADIYRSRRGRPLYPYDLGEPLEYHTPYEDLRPVAPRPTSSLGEFPGLEAIYARPAPAPPIDILRDLPPRAQEDSMRAAIAALTSGEPVKVGEILEAASRSDPRIAESLDLEKPVLTERGFVFDDVFRQLVAAGVPAEEASHNAGVVAARYATRSERLGGELGSAADLYRAEGIEIRRSDTGSLEAEGARSFAQPAIVDGVRVDFPDADHLALYYLGRRLESGAGVDPAEAERLFRRFERFMIEDPLHEQFLRGAGDLQTAARDYYADVHEQVRKGRPFAAWDVVEPDLKADWYRRALNEATARGEPDARRQLQLFQAATERSPAFKSWFGDSRVVGEDGNPRVVYHGTARSGFAQFDTYGANYGLMGQGGYFTEDPAIASTYTSKGEAALRKSGQEPSPGVYPVYLSIKRPLDMEAAPDLAAWQRAFPEYLDAGDIAKAKTNEAVFRKLEDALTEEQLPRYEAAEIVQGGLRGMGFDGVTHIGGGRVDSDGARHRVWIAFDPEQIKSAFNGGAFDAGDPRILFQADRGGREVAVQKNGDIELKQVAIADAGGRTIQEARAAWRGFKDDVVEMATGEKVTFNLARKSLFSRMRGGLGRADLVPHLPEIVRAATPYAEVPDAAVPHQKIVHAAAWVNLNGRDLSVRLVLKDVGDGRLRQYQFEGFEAAPPASRPHPEGFRKLGQGDAAPKTVASAVDDFKAGDRLFQGGEQPRGRITLSDNKALIELFRDADRSTFMHEAGHLWLDELMRDAVHPTAPERLRADRDTVLEWLGVKDTSEIGVAQHEQWARGFENYLATGRAPSTVLAEAFEAFRRWLAEIYRALVGHRQEISPAIRGVMDRLLATDAQIAERRGSIESVPHQPGPKGEAALPVTDAGLVRPPRARGRAAAHPDTWSLTEHLASKGGLKPDPELEAIYGGKRGPFLSGFGPLIRRKGMSLDEALTSAKEHGYMFDPHDAENGSAGVAGRTSMGLAPRDLLDALDAESRGNKLYKAGHLEATKYDVDQERHVVLGHVETELEAAGMKISEVDPKLVDRTVEIVHREGERDVMAAYERAIIEDEERYNAIAADRDADPTHPARTIPYDAGGASGGSRAGSATGGPEGSEPGGRGADRAQPSRDGRSDRATAADSYRKLADVQPEHDQPDIIAASRQADETPEVKTRLDDRVAAAAKAETDSAELYKLLENGLSEEQRTRLEDTLKAIDDEGKLNADVIQRAAACAFRGRE